MHGRKGDRPLVDEMTASINGLVNHNAWKDPCDDMQRGGGAESGSGVDGGRW